MIIRNSKKIIKEKGFSLSEVVITLNITIVVFILLISVYILSQRAFRESYDRYELVQNARVFIDRLSRELRQSKEITTVLPENCDGGAPSEIMFQEGGMEEIRYIKYYVSGINLKRKILAYYFSYAPGTYVYWNSYDSFSQPPIEIVFEDTLIGEYVNSLAYYGVDNIVNVDANFSKNNKNVYTHTIIAGRNL